MEDRIGLWNTNVVSGERNNMGQAVACDDENQVME